MRPKATFIITFFAIVISSEVSGGATLFRSGVRLIGTDTASPLHEINLGTGALTRIDNEPEFSRDLRISMTYDPMSNTLLTANNSTRAPDGIQQYDFETGLFETIFEFDPRETGYPAIAFGSAGVLFAQNVASSIGATGRVGILGLDTGSFTSLTTELPRLFGFSYREQDGLLYGISPGRDLYAINPANGDVSDPIPLSGNITGIVGSLVFLPDGTGLISSDGPKISELDPLTGIVSDGLSLQPGFFPKAMAVLVPEPTTGLLIPMGLLVILMRRRP